MIARVRVLFVGRPGAPNVGRHGFLIPFERRQPAKRSIMAKIVF